MKTQQQALQILENITFGIEIECNFPLEKARQYGIQVTSRNWSSMLSMNHINDLDNNPFTDWEAGYDSTITRKRGYHGIEFTSKVLQGEAGLKSAVRFFKWLEAEGAIVDRSCGLHIHVGVKSFTEGEDIDTAIEMVLKTMKFANSIKTCIFAQGGSAYRYLRHNYATPRVDKNRPEVQARRRSVPTFSDSKFTFLNTHRIAYNGITSNRATVEFRAFAGTCNYQKVLTHLLTAFTCVHAGMTLKRSTWNGRHQTADLGFEAFDAFAKGMSNSDLLKLFPTFVTEKRKMFKVGRKMARKFATNIRRSVTRSNGAIDLNRFA